MKALIISLVTIISCILVFSPAAWATNTVFSDACSGTAATTLVCQQATTSQKANPIIDILKTTIDVISYILGIAAVIVLIIAGLQMIIGGSDPQSVVTARNTLIYALVGIAVAVLAQAIVAFVLDKIK